GAADGSLAVWDVAAAAASAGASEGHDGAS
ncbi:hypothetical protein HaLaN_30564, partial [Haematococcus lacustris]